MERRKFFRELLGLTDEALVHRLAEVSEIRQLKKGWVLYREGE